MPFESWRENTRPFEDPGDPSPPDAERVARRLISEYERLRRGDRNSPECRVAYESLAAHVRARGGWIQWGDVRYTWSRGGRALVRAEVRSGNGSGVVPMKV
jgi:hypothetical protein